jgi:hypothetical protein
MANLDFEWHTRRLVRHAHPSPDKLARPPYLGLGVGPGATRLPRGGGYCCTKPDRGPSARADLLSCRAPVARVVASSRCQGSQLPQDASAISDVARAPCIIPRQPVTSCGGGRSHRRGPSHRGEPWSPPSVVTSRSCQERRALSPPRPRRPTPRSYTVPPPTGPGRESGASLRQVASGLDPAVSAARGRPVAPRGTTVAAPRAYQGAAGIARACREEPDG